MNVWTIAGIIALVAVAVLGSVIKYITHCSLKDLEGTIDTEKDEDGKKGPKEIGV